MTHTQKFYDYTICNSMEFVMLFVLIANIQQVPWGIQRSASQTTIMTTDIAE